MTSVMMPTKTTESIGVLYFGCNRVNQTGSSRSQPAGTLTQGYVETSNVNVVEELVNMIQTQRAYEINSKAVQSSDQMLQRLAQL